MIGSGQRAELLALLEEVWLQAGCIIVQAAATWALPGHPPWPLQPIAGICSYLVLLEGEKFGTSSFWSKDYCLCSSSTKDPALLGPSSLIVPLGHCLPPHVTFCGPIVSLWCFPDTLAFSLAGKNSGKVNIWCCPSTSLFLAPPEAVEEVDCLVGQSLSVLAALTQVGLCSLGFPSCGCECRGKPSTSPKAPCGPWNLTWWAELLLRPPVGDHCTSWVS